MKRIIKQKIRQNKTNMKIDIFEIGKYEYRALLSWEEYFPENGWAVFAAVLGTAFGYHELSDARKEMSQLSIQKRREILHRLLSEIRTIEQIGAGKKMSGNKIYKQYLPNRLRLWEWRIRSLLDLRE
jgi:hypothetical protein